MVNQKIYEISINRQIEEAVKLLNEEKRSECEKLCSEIFHRINEEFGEPNGEEKVGLFRNEYNELEYAEPNLHNILKDLKRDKHESYMYSGLFVNLRLGCLVDYFNSCLLLRYFEVENVLDEE